MFGFVSKLRKIVKEFDDYVNRLKKLEAELNEVKTDIALVGRQLEGVKALEERLENEAVQKAHASAMVEFDLALKQLRNEMNRELEKIRNTYAELEPFLDTMRDYQEFKERTAGDLVAVKSKHATLEERIESLEKRVEGLYHRVAWLDYYVRILWEKEMAKKFKKSRKVKCGVKVEFKAVDKS